MPKYRIKPLVIEAVKITRTITIETSDGTIKGHAGDYLITEPNGEQYPCPSELFEKTYEPMKQRYKMKTLLRKSWRKIKIKSQEITQKK